MLAATRSDSESQKGCPRPKGGRGLSIGNGVTGFGWPVGRDDSWMEQHPK